MARYIVNRVLSGVLTLFLFVTIMFFVVQIALPGDFVTSLGPMTAEDAADLRQQYGLDRPLYVQYFGWLGSILTLDLGFSFARGPV
jgi:peptide/nickel transport system permease protein